MKTFIFLFIFLFLFFGFTYSQNTTIKAKEDNQELPYTYESDIDPHIINGWIGKEKGAFFRINFKWCWYFFSNPDKTSPIKAMAILVLYDTIVDYAYYKDGEFKYFSRSGEDRYIRVYSDDKLFYFEDKKFKERSLDWVKDKLLMFIEDGKVE